jgi:(1->4)-alpha-D-glucan 1-alpha-D-glucosylmutase
MSGLRIPTSTYRLQFHQGFTFRDGEGVVSYLERLGVTDVYSSPPLQARSGSLHGYDVTNHSVLNPELGGEEAFVPFSDALRQRDMGLIVDIVPNHMEIDDPANQWWQDVLENGPSSSFAEFFDIDWSPPKHGLRNRISLPVLGDQFGKVLENGEITLFYEAGGFFVAYYDHRFPIDPHDAAR